MSESITDNVKRATEILGGGNSWNIGDLEKLEKDLAGEGKGELALDIYLLRVKTDVARANAVLSGPAGSPTMETLKEMLVLSKRLAGYKNFNLARQVLKRAREELVNDSNEPLLKDSVPEVCEEVDQKSALYTYKDPDLPRDWQLDRAWDILRHAFNLAKTENQETLGLAGGIFKRKWEADQLRQNLDRSLYYYLRGYAVGVRKEQIEADQLKNNRPPVNDMPAALEAARANVFDFLRAVPKAIAFVEANPP